MEKRKKEREALRLYPRWQLQTAKARFSELVRRVHSEGPQFVTRQGKDVVVVLSAKDYDLVRARSRQPRSLVDFFAESPLAEARLNLERTPDFGRELEL